MIERGLTVSLWEVSHLPFTKKSHKFWFLRDCSLMHQCSGLCSDRNSLMNAREVLVLKATPNFHWNAFSEIHLSHPIWLLVEKNLFSTDFLIYIQQYGFPFRNPLFHRLGVNQTVSFISSLSGRQGNCPSKPLACFPTCFIQRRKINGSTWLLFMLLFLWRKG